MDEWERGRGLWERGCGRCSLDAARHNAWSQEFFTCVEAANLSRDDNDVLVVLGDLKGWHRLLRRHSYVGSLTH